MAHAESRVALRRSRRGRARGRARMGVLIALAGLWVATSGAHRARAYSYAEAGAEPLIDAREETLAALATKDYAAAERVSARAREELGYLDESQGLALVDALDRALRMRDADAVDRVFLDGFAAEIRRRLAGAGENLEDYQLAKTLVVKSKVFFDLLAPALDAERRARADAALRACLEAIGNPGVFGVGARDPDPAAFREQREIIDASIGAP